MKSSVLWNIKSNILNWGIKFNFTDNDKADIFFMILLTDLNLFLMTLMVNCPKSMILRKFKSNFFSSRNKISSSLSSSSSLEFKFASIYVVVSRKSTRIENFICVYFATLSDICNPFLYIFLVFIASDYTW